MKVSKDIANTIAKNNTWVSAWGKRAFLFKIRIGAVKDKAKPNNKPEKIPHFAKVK